MKHPRLVLFSALLSILPGRANGQWNDVREDGPTARIIGGSEAVADRYPYAALLFAMEGYVCGGSLIARDVVLTAAHCNLAAEYAYVGEHDIGDAAGGGRIPFAVREIIPHPNFSDLLMSIFGIVDSDFMLVFLQGPSTADNVVTVKLNSDPSVPSVGRNVTVMGWGDTDIRPGDAYQVMSEVLMNVDVNVISNEECEASEGYVEDGTYSTYNGHITANMLCASADGKDSCQGDSGGPMIIKGDDAATDVQVGVVSFGNGCASDQFPGVYARVSRAYDWIQSEVCKGSSYASEAGFDCNSSVDIDISSNPASIQSINFPTSAPSGASLTNGTICAICPYGATAGDDYAPYAYTGIQFTCSELIESAKQYQPGSEDCAWAEVHELFCCPTVPVNPCIICPTGASAGDDFAPYADIGDPSTCADIIEFNMLFDAGSDYCILYSEIDEYYCCPVDLAVDNTCIICPDGATAGDDYTPYANTDDMLDFVPDFGGSLFGFVDSRTCAELIEAAKQYETGTKWCGMNEIHEVHCCPTIPDNPCNICPNGATAGDDFVPEYQGNTLTCKDIITYTALHETESDYCGYIGKIDESYCCPAEGNISTPLPTQSPADDSEATTSTAENPCIICPDGATAVEGDDFAPYADSGNTMTCGELIDAAKSYEAGSAWCGLREVDAVYCCPVAPVDPCIICPFGAFAGDDFVPRPATGTSTTCKEIINFAMLFESGSHHCKLSEADESLCCPLAANDTATFPSPVFTVQSPTATSPAESESGGASAYRLIGFAMVSIVSTCIIVL
ncbi:hypothetical protein ACHAXA_005456 [Cyclostephanos tholiformis]|uniref:Peptidase S1 domain-containing protein n=1 Tax=Cyclostephanos tholiformis TaxID=382380 RepID=A0ABD3SH79_9STRA